jgi:hypothetical protein
VQHDSDIGYADGIDGLGTEDPAGGGALGREAGRREGGKECEEEKAA